MQEEVQYQAVEDLYRLLQLLADCSDHRRENFHDARGTKP